MKRALLTGASILAVGVGLGLGVTPAAEAAPLPVYADHGQCQQDADARTAGDGGPASGHYYYCAERQGVPAGVAGCPVNPDTQKYGCIGTYWQVRVGGG